MLFSDITCVKTNISKDPPATVFDSAHPPPIIAIACIKKSKSLEYSAVRYDYIKMDVKKIALELESIDWTAIMPENLVVNGIVDIFYNKLYSIIEKFVPRKIKRNSTKQAW